MFGTLIGLGFTTISASAKEYTVKSGDSLWDIAKGNHTSTKAIVDANSLSSASAVILPNQKLNIPTGAKADKSSRITPLTKSSAKASNTSTASNDSKAKQADTKNATSGWTTMVATAYDPQVAAGGQGTSIPTGTGVAAALDRYPKGTQLEIKFQDGHTENRVVNDTGTFTYSNPNQLDISMTNSQAMQFGRQSIQVRVIG
ncbi:LysM peptidoglycan-binding domain-containing protein [Secundilactobacillus hailunensis]|uniref:LysM peptidoglycan-binding domain-containing protein n=1 Tax=Secundilactobacillus hailunensis TaxID=2559923 RepID=A0ABW1T8S8_9LACO|nr:LysM peptidoglycan-binding domain-containing protein [Secundilactobacillus hailunensis]